MIGLVVLLLVIAFLPLSHNMNNFWFCTTISILLCLAFGLDAVDGSQPWSKSLTQIGSVAFVYLLSVLYLTYKARTRA